MGECIGCMRGVPKLWNHVRAFAFVALLAAVLGSGCAELNRTVYSRASEGETRVQPGYSTYTEPQASTSLALEQADLEIHVYNARMSFSMLFAFFVVPVPLRPEYCETEFFQLCIDVRPKVPGLSFDPFQPVVHSEKDSFSPVLVMMSRSCADCPYPSKVGDDEPVVRGPPVEVTTARGFHLLFWVEPLSADEPFTLEVGGLALGEHPLPAPILRFERETMWSYHVMPLGR